jgi:AraC-like DNA-binding protein
LVAQGVGFADPERMRRAFVNLFGMSPQAVRRLDRDRETMVTSARSPT